MEFVDKTGILGQLWIEYRQEPEMEKFISYNDVGLPLAYFLAEGLVKEASPLGEQYVTETMDLLLDTLGVTEAQVTELKIETLETLLQYAADQRLLNDEDKPKE